MNRPAGTKWAIITAMALASGCSYGPKIDANGFVCKASSDCPSDYRCAKAAPSVPMGVCCNRTTDRECLMSTDGSIAPDSALAEVGLGVDTARGRLDGGMGGGLDGPRVLADVPSPSVDGLSDLPLLADARADAPFFSESDVGRTDDLPPGSNPDRPSLSDVVVEAGPEGTSDAPADQPVLGPDAASDPTPVVADLPAGAVATKIAVTLTGLGGGRVSSNPGGIDCGTTCAADFPQGIPVTLVAAADSASTFAGWGGACAGAGTDPCVVTTDDAKSVTATFDKRQLNITVTKAGLGSGQVVSVPAGIDCGNTCSGQFSAGSTVTLTATADATSTFAGWSGTACGTEGSCNVEMGTDKIVTATFNIAQAGVTVIKNGAGGGTVTSTPAGIACGATCTFQFPAGTTIAFSPEADATSVFTGWAGACTGPGACSFVAGGGQSVTATFAKGAGATCMATGDCHTGTCTDSRCCTQTCGTCEACTGAGGTCVKVKNGPDPDTCTGVTSCDDTGLCKNIAGQPCTGGGNCLTGYCVDDVCCTQSSCPQCRNCGGDGNCSVIVSSTVDTTGATCAAETHSACNGSSVCTCNLGYQGTNCSECAPGYTNYPNCVLADPCQPDPCNGHGTCANGTCTSCNAGFAGTTCAECAPGFTGYPNCAGGAWVESWKQSGETSTSYFGGGGVSYGPDTNGDGIGDVLVGAYGVNSYTGAAYLYSGKDGSLLQSWTGEATNSNFGGAVSLGPDVTGDGRADVLIAAPAFNSQTGKVYLYDGATGAFLRSWPGLATYDDFGYAISLGPDTNGDGRGDVLIGMVNSTATGQAFLYSGATGTLLKTFSGTESLGRFGAAVFLGPDVSGDGRGEVLVSEPWATVNGGAKTGKVTLYSGASGSQLLSWSGEAAGDRLAYALSMGADADGDGKADVAIGAASASDGTVSSVGKAYIYSTKDGSLIRSFKGPYSGSTFGARVSLGADADGDGRGDLLVGSDGNFAALFSSQTGIMRSLWTGAASSGFGHAVSLGASMNGDARPELAIASDSEGSGRGSVRFYTSNAGTCIADCTGRCGGASDGCGGTCTTVPPGYLCNQQFLVADPCSPDPCNGHGTCTLGACTCGSGFAGTTCNQCDVGYQTYPTCSAMCSAATPVSATPSGTTPIRPAAAWNGTEWGVLFRDTTAPSKTMFARLDTSGARKTGSEVTVAASADSPAIAWSSDYNRYGAVWSNGTNVFFACLDTNGAIVGSAQQASPSGSVGSTKPRITSQGSYFGVVWDDSSSGKRQVYFLRFSANTCSSAGSIARVNAVTTNTSGEPDVAYGAAQYAVTWFYQDASTFKLYLMYSRVDETGAKVAGSDVTIAEIISGAGSPHARLSWNVTNYQFGVAYLQGDVKMSFVRFNSSGAMVGSPTLYSNDSQTVSPSAEIGITSVGTTWGLSWTESATYGRFMRVDSAGAKASPVLGVGGFGPSLATSGTDFFYVYYPPSSPYGLMSSRITCP